MVSEDLHYTRTKPWEDRCSIDTPYNKPPGDCATLPVLCV